LHDDNHNNSSNNIILNIHTYMYVYIYVISKKKIIIFEVNHYFEFSLFGFYFVLFCALFVHGARW